MPKEAATNGREEYGSNRAKGRTPGLKANYQSATPEEVAGTFYWHRRKKTSRRVQRNRAS